MGKSRLRKNKELKDREPSNVQDKIYAKVRKSGTGSKVVGQRMIKDTHWEKKTADRAKVYNAVRKHKKRDIKR
jgi:2-keto-3-deoxy-6-phosphogluconate aldolase